MDIQERFHINTRDRDAPPMLFAHGFGCDQSMWRFVAPAFEDSHRVVLFDLAGSGQADPSAYNPTRHASLRGYAEDVIDIVETLDLRDVVFVGHSVSASIGLLAAIARPERFARLVLVAPSPCYIDDGDYRGGFSRQDIEGMVDTLDSNYLGWVSAITPTIMGHPERPELTEELKNSFCRTHPEIARAFARVTFLADNRGDLPKVTTPSLILQCSDDVIAPPSVGTYMHQHLADSKLTLIETRGHCPHLSDPQQTIEAMQAYLQRT